MSWTQVSPAGLSHCFSLGMPPPSCSGVWSCRLESFLPFIESAKYLSKILPSLSPLLSLLSHRDPAEPFACMGNDARKPRMNDDKSHRAACPLVPMCSKLSSGGCVCAPLWNCSNLLAPNSRRDSFIQCELVSQQEG